MYLKLKPCSHILMSSHPKNMFSCLQTPKNMFLCSYVFKPKKHVLMFLCLQKNQETCSYVFKIKNHVLMSSKLKPCSHVRHSYIVI